MKKITEIETKEDSDWRRGYNLGVQTAMRQNDIAIKIGRAILDALDERYEFSKEDY